MYPSGGGNVTELDLEHKNISSAGVAALGRALSAHDSPGGCRLRVLRLGRNPLGLEGLSALLMCGQQLQLRTIRVLDLQQTQLDATKAGSGRSLTTLFQLMSRLSAEHSLRELVLDDNKLGNAGE